MDALSQYFLPCLSDSPEVVFYFKSGKQSWISRWILYIHGDFQKSHQQPSTRCKSRKSVPPKTDTPFSFSIQLLPALLFGVWASGGAFSGGLPVQAAVTGPLAPRPPPASRLRVRSRPPRPAGPTWRRRCRNT